MVHTRQPALTVYPGAHDIVVQLQLYIILTSATMGGSGSGSGSFATMGGSSGGSWLNGDGDGDARWR